MTVRRRQWAEALGFAACMAGFGLCAHRPALIVPRVAALVAAAAILAGALVLAERPVQQLGLSRPPARRLGWLVPMIALGIGLGCLYRWRTGLSIWPGRMGGLALVAVGIGACEELAYRGFVQGWSGGPALGGAIAAAAHTAYKVALFSLPPAGVRPDIPALAVATFSVGLVFGLARQGLGAAVFPLAAHVAFDAVAYGDISALPWWVL